MSLNNEHAYRVVEESGTFQVIDPGGRSIMACNDARNAEQYAVTLTKAFRQGYKAGFRDAKRGKDI